MLSEPEILQIACDIGLGIANMHYLSPPLIHRDLKIENVLISGDGLYKLCDFGSVSVTLRPPRNAAEFQILDNDIQSHTTAQYRSPEMIDIARGFPIDEKSDIWAFGVFIYKLCYYTTPFEREGNLAILNASFSFPPKPLYSDRLKRIINVTLSEDPRLRPNIFQCLKELFSMRGMDVPIKDIYDAPTSTTWVNSSAPQDKVRKSLPIEDSSSSVDITSTVSSRGAVHVVSKAKSSEKVIPDVQPMYRGRPQNSLQKKSPVPPIPKKFNTEGDPFLIDGNSSPADKIAEDVESKYPTIEALTQSMEQQSFDFSSPTPHHLTSYSSTVLSSYSSAPEKATSVSVPNSVSQTPAYENMEQNVRNSGYSSATWVPKGYNGQSPNDAWKPASRPLMVSQGTSPIGSPSTTPAFSKHTSYDSSSSDDDETVPPARNIPPRPLSSVSRGRKSEDSSKRPDIQIHRPEKKDSRSAPPALPKRKGSREINDSRQMEPPGSEDKDRLKELLTGLSGKSTTILLEEENFQESSRYLKPLDKEGTGKSWRSGHRRSRSRQRSPYDGEDKRERSRSRSRPGHVKTTSSSLKSKINKMFETPRAVSGIQKRVSIEYTTTPSYSAENSERYEKDNRDPETIVRASSFMESEDPSQFQRPKPRKQEFNTVPKTEPSPVSNPAFSIQKRIQAFINRSPSPPPRRTAVGYGIYTDSGSPPADDTSSFEGMRKLPPRPPSKPKHLQSPRRQRSEEQIQKLRD